MYLPKLAAQQVEESVLPQGEAEDPSGPRDSVMGATLELGQDEQPARWDSALWLQLALPTCQDSSLASSCLKAQLFLL